MLPYTPVPGRITTINLPQDMIDQRQVSTVNEPFQDLADGVAQMQNEMDTAIVNYTALIDALPGVGTKYDGILSVPLMGAVPESASDWNLETYGGYLMGIVQQSVASAVKAIVPLYNLPLTGKIIYYKVALAGSPGPGADHSAVPEYPVYTQLRKWDVTNGSVLIGSTVESGGITQAQYDTYHVQTSGILNHTISHRGPNPDYYPCHYSLLIFGETGANAQVGTEVYAATIFMQGVDA